MAESDFRRVLIAIKPWHRGSRLAVERACEFALKIDAEIQLVSVVFDSIVSAGFEGAEALEAVSKARLMEAERLELEGLATSLRDRHATVDVCVEWDAIAHRGILRAARERQADLLIVGEHEQGSVLHTFLTDTDWQLMRLCSCPLLLMRSAAFEGYSTILAAIEPSSDHAERGAVNRDVLTAAQRLGRLLHSQVRAVHAFPDPTKFAFASAVEVSPGIYYGTENFRELHQASVQALVRGYGIDPNQVDVRPGEPGDVITQAVVERDASLVVLGLSRRSLLAQAILSGTAENVTAEAPCDVLLVPQPSSRAFAPPPEDSVESGSRAGATYHA